tara:strand:- start:270 stop:1586 length:1317 start_codon:yes stop_codon:yes gene_type:complete
VKTRIYIGTASGPVQVQRIWREAGIAESMVCLKRTTETLPIGTAYNAFVKSPSGVIERIFGPFEEGGFRLELSDRINQGTSWQLAIFIAHALARDGQLAGPEDDYQRAVWLTGQVDHDLKTGAVDQIPEKIYAAAPPLKALINEGKAVLIFAPEQNSRALASASLPSGIDVHAVTSAIDVLQTLEIPLESQSSRPKLMQRQTRDYHNLRTGHSNEPHRAKRTLIGTVFLLLASGAITAGFIVPSIFSANEPLPEIVNTIKEKVTRAETKQTQVLSTAEKLPPVALPQLTISEIRAAPGGGCPAVHFGASAGVASELTETSIGEYASSPGVETCALAFTVTPTMKRTYMALAIEPILGRYVENEPIPISLMGGKSITAPITWRINLPLVKNSKYVFKLHLLSAQNPITADILKSVKTENFSADDDANLLSVIALLTVVP